MAFQAMNHGLEARATSPQEFEATHNLKADSALGGSVTGSYTRTWGVPTMQRRLTESDQGRAP